MKDVGGDQAGGPGEGELQGRWGEFGDRRGTRVGAVARSVYVAAGFTPDIRHAVNDRGAPVEAGQGVEPAPRPVRPAYAHRDLALLTTDDGTPPSRHVFAAVRTGAEGDPVPATVLDRLRLSGLLSSGRDRPVVAAQDPVRERHVEFADETEAQ
ncbi:hypothetical protein OG806_18735 [Streptomyces sp. NBC_00882]|uniref:hypothetical protein n=1 Tax=Streptomyces TaxID=1883 RepID=UPI00386C9C35|nr:hypothetical protein OG806_18735 [Streptomyces sp. NBC_00882]WSZ58216.1 hypothetical protein OH824_17415 [Streptomyces canus]